MTKKIANNTLIVVADGEKATLFKNTSDSEVKLQSAGAMSVDYLNDKGPSGLPPETSDKEKGEATFAKHMATDLYNKVQGGDFDKLVLIADPQTLGQMRPHLHDEVTKRLILEIPKTLTNSTIDDIEKTIEKALK